MNKQEPFPPFSLIIRGDTDVLSLMGTTLPDGTLSKNMLGRAANFITGRHFNRFGFLDGGRGNGVTFDNPKTIKKELFTYHPGLNIGPKIASTIIDFACVMTSVTPEQILLINENLAHLQLNKSREMVDQH